MGALLIDAALVWPWMTSAGLPLRTWVKFGVHNVSSQDDDMLFA
jgi:hypothetical protein